jgi:hypothetical protein
MNLKNYNDIMIAERDGKLPSFGIADLKSMRLTCVWQIHSGYNVTLATGTIETLDKEIRRKEDEERELKEIERQKIIIGKVDSLKHSVDQLSKPHPVLWWTLIATALAALAGLILLFR